MKDSMLSEIILRIGGALDMADVIEFVIIGFALGLLALSLSAYRNSGMKRILFAAGAFSLFAIQLFVDYVKEFFDFLNEDTTDIVQSLITLGILILFFMAIVKRK
jgi:hypothetical protein